MDFLLIIESAKGLRNADGMFGTSDPYAMITCPSAPACLSEKTEVAQNNLNPEWDCCLVVTLPPASTPVIKIEVFDSDRGKYGPRDDFLGQASFDLAALLAAGRPGCWATSTADLGGDAKAKGSITISVRPYRDFVVTACGAVKLRNADGFFGKSDPYVRLLGLTGGSANWGETKTIRDNLNPTWDEAFTVKCLERNPMGGKLMPFVAEVWDEDDKKRSKSDDPLGSVVVPWKKLWPEAPNFANQACPLKGKGAKEGSTLILKFELAAAGDQESLAAAGRNLLASSLLPAPPAAAAAVTPPATPVVKVSKKACKAVLSKGVGFKVADCTDTIADNFSLGLAWDMTGGKAIDLDASCILLDKSLCPVDTVSFQKLRSADGSMVHQGDEREGDEEGDDETICVDLERVSKQATFLCFCINSFSGHELNDVANAKCRLYNSGTGHELCTFDLSSDARLDCTALLMCILYRAGPSGTDWFMHAVGEPANGRTAQENVDEFQAFLLGQPLVERQNAHLAQSSGPPKMAKITVPAQMGGKTGRTVGFRTAAGARQEVDIPPNCSAGTTVEVPIIDIY
mmetsp:Transcript_47433/g.80945  ORF Transcript_47433/g.80945 Transcript_47433/m.80945 type:complete len:571 (-) Transcript_47433:194-1906(-)